MSEARQPADPAVENAAVTGAASEPPPEEIAGEEDVIADLRRQLAEADEEARQHRTEVAAEKRAREAAEARRVEAESRAAEADRRARASETTSRRTVEDAQLDVIGNALNAHEQQMAALQGRFSALFAEGNHEELGKVQAEMARLGGRIAQLEQGKVELETRKAAREQGGERQVEDRPAPQDDAMAQREAWIRGQPPLVQTWLHNNPQFFSDPAFQQNAIAASNYAIKIKRMSASSQEYIDFVDGELGLRNAEAPRRGEQPAGRATLERESRRREGARDRERMVGAPVGGPGSAGARPATTIYLTKEQKAAAAQSGVSEAAYAQAVRELTEEGRIGPNARQS